MAPQPCREPKRACGSIGVRRTRAKGEGKHLTGQTGQTSLVAMASSSWRPRNPELVIRDSHGPNLFVLYIVIVDVLIAKEGPEGEDCFNN